jgi:hypothetical protein
MGAVHPPTSLEFTDAFAETDGTPIADMPVSTMDTGSVEGLQGAVGQIDALLV